MTSFIQRVLKTKFVARSKVIFLGTIVAQAITFGTSFVITAFYTPEDLGLLGTLTALISVAAGTLSFRLEVAVIQATDEDATEVFLKSTILGGLACTAFSLLCFFLPWDFAKKITAFLVPFILWCWGYCFFFNSRQMTFKFNRLEMSSWGSIARSTFTLIFQYLGGLLRPDFGTLLSGRISGDYIGAIVHSMKFVKKFSWRHVNHRWEHFIRKHADFVLFMAPQHFLFAMSNNILIFFLERGYGLAVAGFFALGQRLIMAPIEIIGSTIANVTMQRFGELRDEPHHLRTFYLRVIALTATMCIGTGGAIWIGAGFVIPLLGTKWLAATDMVKGLVPFFMSYLFNMPTTNFLRFVNKSRIQLVLEMIELGSKVLGIVLIEWKDYQTLILFYGSASLGFSLFRTLIVLRLIRPAKA